MKHKGNFKQWFNVFLIISEAWQVYESKAWVVLNLHLQLQPKKLSSTRDIPNFPTQGWADTTFCTISWNRTYLYLYYLFSTWVHHVLGWRMLCLAPHPTIYFRVIWITTCECKKCFIPLPSYMGKLMGYSEEINFNGVCFRLKGITVLHFMVKWITLLPPSLGEIYWSYPFASQLKS